AFPLLVEWERRHGSLLSGALAARRARKTAAVPGPPAPKGLLSFRDGLEALPRALATRLAGSLRLKTPATSLSPRGGRWSAAAPGAGIAAARVIVAAPGERAGALVADFAPEASRALAAMPQPPLAVLHLGCKNGALRRPLSGFGHLVAPSADRRILGA